MVPSLQLSRGTLMTMLFTFLRVLVLQEYDNYYWKLNFIGYLVPKLCKYDTWWYKLCVTGYLVPKCAKMIFVNRKIFQLLTNLSAGAVVIWSQKCGYINLVVDISCHCLLAPKN